MHPGDANIEECFHRTPHHACRHSGFFRHRNIRGTGGDNQHISLWLGDGRLNDHHAGIFLIHGAAADPFQSSRNIWIGTSGQHGDLFLHKSLSDGDDLSFSLAFTENRFWHTLAKRPMMINFRKSKIFVWKGLKLVKRTLDRKRSFLDLLEKQL